MSGTPQSDGVSCPVPVVLSGFCRQSFSPSRGSVGAFPLWETSFGGQAKSVTLGRIPPSRGGNLVKRTKLAPSYRAPWKSPASGPSIAGPRPSFSGLVVESPRFCHRSTRPGWTDSGIGRVWCGAVAMGGRSAGRSNASAGRLHTVNGSRVQLRLCKSSAPRRPQFRRAHATLAVPWVLTGVFRPNIGR